MARARLTQRRRLQALEAAVEVIAERGLGDTRVADIARRAGLSPGLLLYYFKSKDDLLTEALTFAEDRFYLETWHELTDLDDPPRRLLRLISLSCPSGDPADPGDWTLWVELWARALRHPDSRRNREALDRRWRSTIAEIVRAGQEGGHFDGSLDADDFALGLAALIDGLALQVVLNDPSVSSDKMRRLCIETAASQLRFEVPEEATTTAGRRESAIR
jgi:AcrR family transcriptional regulator